MHETKSQIKKRLEAELERIQRDLAVLEVKDEVKFLANTLHGSLCRYEHTEACGWFYEKSNGEWDWSGWAHDRWLENAAKFTLACKDNGITQEQGLALAEFIKTIR